jgi:UDP-glucose:glycoprotein glucosyltransferase
MRLTFVHSPSGDAELTEEQTASSSLVAHLVMNGQMSENGVTPEKLGKALGLDIGGAQDSILEQSQVPLEDSRHIFPSKKADDQTYKEFVQASKLLARELGFAPGESGLVINGRIIGPIERGAFIAADFKALEEYEYKKRTAAAIETFGNVCPWVNDLGRSVSPLPSY